MGRAWARKRPALFEPWLTVDGKRVKMTRKDYAVAYYLWAKHKDIRTGKV